MKKTTLLSILFVFMLCGVSSAQMYESNVEVGAGLYVSGEEGISSTGELNLGYSFGVYESLHAKTFVSAYSLKPDDDYKTYDETGTDFENIPTVNVGISVYNYFPVGVTADLFPEIGAYMSYQSIEFKDASGVLNKDEAFGGGLILGGGIRINQRFKASLHYRIQSSDVDDGGVSAQVAVIF